MAIHSDRAIVYHYPSHKNSFASPGITLIMQIYHRRDGMIINIRLMGLQPNKKIPLMQNIQLKLHAST
jgi:hypothetical protein